MPELPTGTITFVFTDIEGSTTLWEQHPSAARAALVRHDALVEQVVAEHAGHVVRPRGEGDSRFAVFPRASDGLTAAAELQQALFDEVWPTPTPIKVRMGLHTGEADWRDGDYYGSAVNRAARLRGVAHGGQTLVSLATEQLVRELLPTGTFLRDLGEGGLRGLRRAEHVFQLVVSGLPADFPALKDFDARYLEPIDGAPAAMHNPYKGLRAFHEADAHDFFGRETLTERLLARLAETGPVARFLAVVGPSGSGKSSVVRAGVVPALRRGALPGSERWLLAELIPGAHPLEELEAVLLSIAVNPPASLLEQLREDERGLLRAVKRVLPRDDTSELVLVIDQFEEIFTLVTSEPARVHFLTSLHAAVTDPRSRIRVIITLRADFYDRPLLYPDPGELLRQRTEVVLPLAAEELEQAIVRPAARTGATLEPELVAALVKDVGEQPGALPLLQYALTELFEQREGRTLTLHAYRESGGLMGTLARRAEELYAGLTEEEQAAGRQLFLRLLTLGEGVEDTRRRVRRAELATVAGDVGAMNRVIDVYGRYRLLTFDQDSITHGPTVEVAHEALLRNWPRLQGWLEATRANLRLERQLLAAAGEWAASGKERSFLVSGARLAQFEGLGQQKEVALTAEERDYLDASLDERVRQQAVERRTATRLRRRAIYLSIALILALAGAGAATLFARTSRASFVQAERVRLAAQAQNALDTGESGDLPALLALRSLQLGYSPQADAPLLRALERGLTRQQYLGHTYFVWSVAFSPDGKYVLTGSADQTARLWDAATGKEVRRFAGHTNVINSAVFAPDGRTVLTASYDGTARLWDAATGQELRRFSGHAGTVWDATFSPDGTYVLTGGDDRTARLWDVETSKEVRSFTGHGAAITAVAFSPDGKSVLTGSDDVTARLFDAQTGTETRRIAGHSDGVTDVAFSPNGKFVLTSSWDKTVRLWDSGTGAERRTFAHSGGIQDAVFSPDGKYVLTANADDGKAHLWITETGLEVHEFVGHPNEVTAVAFSPDGKYVLTGSRDYTARLWDVEGADEPRLFSGHTEFSDTVAFSPDGKYVLTGSGDHTVRLWDAATGKELHQFTGHTDPVKSVAFSPDGKTVLTSSDDSTVRLWDTRTGKEMQRFTAAPERVFRAIFSPDSQYLLVGLVDQTIRLWDAHTGREVRQFREQAGFPVGIAFSPDNRYVASASNVPPVQMWDRETGRLVRQFIGHTSEISGLAFSPDGRYLLTASWDRTARLWDVGTGKEVRRFTGHSDVVRAVAFSPDGRYVVTGGWDQTARLWETQTGRQVRIFAHTVVEIQSVAFAPDGSAVVTAANDGSVRLWHIDYHQAIQVACAKLTRDFTDEERRLYDITGSRPTCERP